MRKLLLTLAVMGAFAASCGKKQPPMSSAPASPGKEGVSVEGSTSSSSIPAAPTPPGAAGSGEPGEAPAPASQTEQSLKALTDALRTYMQVSSDYPKDLKVLAEMKLIPKMPVPPAGKKFVVDRATISVVLADK